MARAGPERSLFLTINTLAQASCACISSINPAKASGLSNHQLHLQLLRSFRLALGCTARNINSRSGLLLGLHMALRASAAKAQAFATPNLQVSIFCLV